METAWFPACVGIWNFWSPVSELSTLVIIPFIGAQIGAIIVFMVGGYIVEVLGWVYMFYIPGVLSLIWCLLWAYLVFETPQEHPTITQEEKQYILCEKTASLVKKDIPFISILRSKSFWALMAGYLGCTFHFYFALSLFPLYMNRYQNISASKSGVYSAIPLIVNTSMMLIFAPMSDFLAKKWNLRSVRRIYIFVGYFGSSAILFFMLKAGCDVNFALAIITIQSMMIACESVSSKTNTCEIAPHHACIMNAMINTVSNSTGFWAPYLGGIVFDNFGHTDLGWSILFYGSAIFGMVTGAIFMLLFSVEEADFSKNAQSENRMEKDSRDDELKMMN